jgi:hypothetical protein
VLLSWLPRPSRHLHFPLIAALSCCLLLAVTGSANAASCTDYFKGGDDPVGYPANDWSLAGNWSNGVPLATTNVCIDNTYLGGGYTVAIDTYNPGLVANSITLGGSGSNVITLSILGTGAGVQVGNLLTLTNQSDGGGVSANGAITLGSLSSGQPGSIDVDAGTLVNDGTITSEPVGNNGAYNSINGSVDNAGTLEINWLFSTNLGTWTNTGAINVASGTTFGVNAPSNPTNSSFTLTAGSINNSGTWTDNNGAFSATGTGNLTGNPPELDNTTINLSGTGTGLVHLMGGGTLGGNIGSNYTLWASGIPGYTHGTLDVDNSVTNNGTLELGSIDGTHGTLDVISGTFTNDANLVFMNTGNGPDGLDGVLVNNGTVTDPNGTGGVIGSGAITNNGTFSLPAGATFGATSFAQSAGGTLALALSGSAIAELQLSGAATLAGKLSISTTGSEKGSFPVISSASVSGKFGSLAFTGQSYTPVYTATGLSLTGPAVVAAVKPKVTTLKVSGSTLKLKLTCPRGDTACKAAVKVTFREKVKGKIKQVVIASARMTVKAGKTATLTVKLDAAGRKLLKKDHKLTASAMVSSGKSTLRKATVRFS